MGRRQPTLSIDLLTNTADAAVRQSTSSAEYLIGEIKRHKRGAVLAAAAMVIGGCRCGLSLFLEGSGILCQQAAKPIDSVAVLPFVNVSADPNTEYLSDGISDSIINSLSPMPKLKVMSLNSVLRYKGQADRPAGGGARAECPRSADEQVRFSREII